MRRWTLRCLLLLHGSLCTLSAAFVSSPLHTKETRVGPSRNIHLRYKVAMSEQSMSPAVMSLHRFAVKGMDGDPMDSVSLTAGEAFPFDREWAILRGDKADVVNFDPKAPQWVHKENFFCAFSKGEALASLATRFDDKSKVLSVRLKERGDLEPIEADMTDSAQLGRLEEFLSTQVFEGAELKIVTAEKQNHEPHRHQFGNTASGVKHNGDTRTVHIINANTVQQVSAALGVELEPERFRANVIVRGLEPWAEFDWVGGPPISLGSAQLSVIKRTVRCAGINVSPRSGRTDLDLPKLLAEHFPQHGPYLGVYAQVVGGGSIAVGDPVRWM